MNYLLCLLFLSCAHKPDTLVCYNDYKRIEEETGKGTVNFFGGYYIVGYINGSNCFVREGK